MNRMIPVLLLIPALAAWHASLAQSAQAAMQQPGNTSIAGVVVNAVTGAPLDRVDVRISIDGDQSAEAGETLTSANGGFRFDGLPQGKYNLQASRRGYIASGYQGHNGFSTAIVTGAQLDTTHLRFPLTPFGVIDGTISDDNGDPVEDALVRLFRQDESQGEGRIMSAGQQQSDDRGTFEFAQLRPGSYFICVTATPWYAFRPAPQLDNNGNAVADDQQSTSPLDAAYPLTFYPNATDSSGATPIPVRGGDRLQINFSLHAVPAIHIRLRLPVQVSENSKGQIVSLRTVGIGTPQLTQDAFGIPINLQVQPGLGSGFRPGQHTMEFQYTGLAPGQYELRQDASTVPLDASHSLALDAPAPVPDADVTGKVGMASGGALPHNMMVVAQRVSGEALQRTAGIQNDGSFTLHNMAPGVYEVTVRGASGALTVAQMAASGAEVHGNRITVGPEPVLLAATLARGSATIDGFVQRDGRGLGGAMVELVPDDPNLPTELIRRDQSNSDGSFTLRRVVPGNYTLVAIEDGWTLDWAKRDALTAYLSRGVKVHVADDEKLQLPSPVRVQER